MPGHLPHSRSLDAPPGNWYAHLYAACQVVAGPLDVSLEAISQVEEAWASRRGTTAQVHRVAEAAGLYAHETALSSRWWTRTSHPFVGILADSGQPVAVQRGTNGFFYTDPEDGAVVPVTESTASRLESVGYHLYEIRLSELSASALSRTAGQRVGRTASLLGGEILFGVLLLVGGGWILGQVAAPPTAGRELGLAAVCGGATVAALTGLVYDAWHRATTFSQTVRLNLDAAFNERLIRLPLCFFWDHDRSDLAERAARWFDGTRVLGACLVKGGAGLLGSLACGGALLLSGIPGTALVMTVGGGLIGLLRIGGGARNPTDWGRTARLADGIRDRIQSLARLRLSGTTDAAVANWLDQAESDGWFSESPCTRPPVGRIALAGGGALLVGIAALAVQGAAAALPAQISLLFWATGGGLAGAVFGEAIAEGRHAWSNLQAARPFVEGLSGGGLGAVAPTCTGAVALDGVTVHPDGVPAPVLEDVTWTVPAGTLAVVRGPTGSGTTTLLRTLLGLVPGASGTVRYDNVVLTPETAPAIRSQVTYLRQDSSIGGDMARAVLGERLRDATAGAAWTPLEQVGLKEMVEALPMQLQTRVSASTFSAGERQRVRLAHVFAQNTPIKLLDAPFGAIDRGPLETILDSLTALDATSIVVTRRETVTARADRVYELRDGALRRHS